MIRLSALLALGSLAVAASPVFAQEADGPDVQAPNWLVRPVGEYPSAAFAAGVTEGSVRLRCRVAPPGIPQDCEVLSEEPPGFGFAEATIRGLASARLASPDGSGPNDIVTFTTRYEFDDEGMPGAEGMQPPDGAWRPSHFVTLDCEILEDGAVRDCRLVREQPEGQGLGARALSIQSQLRLPPLPEWRPGIRTVLEMDMTPRPGPPAS